MVNFEDTLLLLDDKLTNESGDCNYAMVSECIGEHDAAAEALRLLVLVGDSDNRHIKALQDAFIEYFGTDKDTELVESDLNDNVY